MKRSSVQGTFLLLTVPCLVLLVWLLVYTFLSTGFFGYYPFSLLDLPVALCFVPMFLTIGIGLLVLRRSAPISRTTRALPFLAVGALWLIMVMEDYLYDATELAAAIGTAIALCLCVVHLVFMVKDFARIRKGSVSTGKWMLLARVTLYAALTVLIIGVASYIFGQISWDGGYASAEYQIVFSDRDGNPLPGVTLRVHDESIYRFDYPVTDLRVLRAPTSDENGLLTFHHVSRGIEFGGTIWNLFFLIKVEKTPPLPVYHCKFFHDHREIYSVKYDDLNAEVDRRWDDLPRVKRTPEELGLEPYETDSTEFEFPVLRREVVVEAL
jgi:hypothetical protein